MMLYNTKARGRLAQLVEHSLDVRRVSGSSPLTSTKSPGASAFGFFIIRKTRGDYVSKQVLNPYLPSWEYIPDGEPHVFGGRLYIYGSHDKFGGTHFCENEYVCWSAPEEDLTSFRYEGVIYNRLEEPKNRLLKSTMYAPDVCIGTDGRYYLYYGLNSLPFIGVAVCDTPCGSFKFYGHVHHTDGTLYGRKKGDGFPFDPGIINDGGRVLLYSSFSPSVWYMRIPIALMGRTKGACGNKVIELESDMLTVKSVKPLIPGTANSSGTGFEGHEFYEASSILKFNGLYYFIYSSVLSHELAYAVSTRPDGGFEYAGTLHSNGDIGRRPPALRIPANRCFHRIPNPGPIRFQIPENTGNP